MHSGHLFVLLNCWLQQDSISHTLQCITLQSYIEKQNVRWVAHVVRAPNETLTKRLMFEEEKYVKVGHHHKTVYERVIKTEEDRGVSAETFLRNCMRRKTVGQSTTCS